jgi:hypothetical protein
MEKEVVRYRSFAVDAPGVHSTRRYRFPLLVQIESAKLFPLFRGLIFRGLGRGGADAGNLHRRDCGFVAHQVLQIAGCYLPESMAAIDHVSRDSMCALISIMHLPGPVTHSPIQPSECKTRGFAPCRMLTPTCAARQARSEGVDTGSV